jgi:hypothetical protein
MRTSLSRHFYRLDEVRSALRDCIVNRRVDKGLFWTQELLDSGEDEYLFETLVEVWAFAVGPAKFRWVTDAYQVGREDLLMLSLQLLRLPHEAADGSLLGMTLQAYEDCRRGGKLASPVTAFREAIRKGAVRTAAAAWLQLDVASGAAVLGEQCALAPASKTLALEALSTWASWAPGSLARPIWGTLTAMMAIMVLCMNEVQWSASISPYRKMTDDMQTRILELLADWRGLLGRRERRVFEIPRDCLKWDTERGRMRWTENTTEELWRIWEVMDGTRCWDDLAATTGYAWSGYDTTGWAEFIEAAFPDDWPEEWSVEDQRLSHGFGSLSPAERLYRLQWLGRWLPAAGLLAESADAIKRRVSELETELGGKPDAVYMCEFLECLPAVEAMGWASLALSAPVPECPLVGAITQGVRKIKLKKASPS